MGRYRYKAVSPNCGGIVTAMMQALLNSCSSNTAMSNISSKSNNNNDSNSTVMSSSASFKKLWETLRYECDIWQAMQFWNFSFIFALFVDYLLWQSNIEQRIGWWISLTLLWIKSMGTDWAPAWAYTQVSTHRDTQLHSRGVVLTIFYFFYFIFFLNDFYSDWIAHIH